MSLGQESDGALGYSTVTKLLALSSDLSEFLCVILQLIKAMQKKLQYEQKACRNKNVKMRKGGLDFNSLKIFDRNKS